jgi:hypothetical protein
MKYLIGLKSGREIGNVDLTKDEFDSLSSDMRGYPSKMKVLNTPVGTLYIPVGNIEFILKMS